MRIGLATTGLMHMRRVISDMLGGTCWFLPLAFGQVDMVAGWGHKPTAWKARTFARRHGLPYVAFEEGLLGNPSGEKAVIPYSIVMDRSGIYYDRRSHNDFEMLVKGRAISRQQRAQAEEKIAFLRDNRLTKFNGARLNDVAPLNLKSSARSDRILIVDQTLGDASIDGAGASAATFADMLIKAAEDHPDKELIVKIHPETQAGRKAGHFAEEQVQALFSRSPALERSYNQGTLRLTGESINPWALLEACGSVYCVSSQLGFEGLMAGCEVNSFGRSFYAGWGLTKDHGVAQTLGSDSSATLEQLVHAMYFRYSTRT